MALAAYLQAMNKPPVFIASKTHIHVAFHGVACEQTLVLEYGELVYSIQYDMHG